MSSGFWSEVGKIVLPLFFAGSIGFGSYSILEMTELRDRVTVLESEKAEKTDVNELRIVLAELGTTIRHNSEVMEEVKQALREK